MSDTTWPTAPRRPHPDRGDDHRLDVIVAADDLVEREGLVHMLADLAEGTAATTSVGSLPELLELLGKSDDGAATTTADTAVCVVDLARVPGARPDGAVVEAIRAVRSDLGVVVLTRDVDPALARAIAEPAAVGLGYLRRSALRRAEDLQRWVADVAAGRVVLDHTMAAELVRFRHAEDRIDGLSDLDQTVGDLMALGATDHAIALQLGVPLALVRNATRKLSRQLDVTGDPLVNRRVRTVVSWLRHRQQTLAV